MIAKKEASASFDSDVATLLAAKESEIFDRTLGGQESIGKTIAGFGTKNGGLLLVGQEDLSKGGTVLGVSTTFQQDFAHAIENVKPAPLTQQRIINYQGKNLVLIKVQDAGSLRPCAYKGIYYERKGDAVLQLQPEEVRRYYLAYGSTNAENMPTHATKEHIDQEELKTYADLLKKTHSAILQTVLTKQENLTIRGVIILAKKPDDTIEGAFVEIQRYDSIMGTQPVPIGSPIKISKPARQLIQEVTEIVQQNIPAQQTYRGAQMITTPAIPLSVIREVITNAAAHRNYQSNEHIRIRIYADGFDISNPAIITQKMWQELQQHHTTYHPNEGVYTFLNPALSYEGRGEGIWKIKEELEHLQKTPPEFAVIGEAPSTFYVKINLTPAQARNARLNKLTELFSNKKEITSHEVMKKLNISRVTAIKLLNQLVKQGTLTHQGTTRTSKYIITNSQPQKTKPNT